jgi:hypothetical protein
MNELLKKLLEAQILTPEVSAELQEAFDAHLATVVAEAREQETIAVRAELVEQWLQEREVLVEALDSKIDAWLKDEVEALKEDISSFRDLEAEYAGKLVEARAAMATELQEDMAQLVVQLDSFIESRLQVELNELKEDLQIAKENTIGRKIFETFKATIVENIDESSTTAKLAETSAKLEDANGKIARIVKENQQLQRSAQLSELLAPLSGFKREVMENILSSVPTDKLSESYEKFIGRVLNETASQPKTEKENTVLSEANNPVKRIDSNTIIKTGNTTDSAPLNENVSVLEPEYVASLKRLSGQA